MGLYISESDYSPLTPKIDPDGKVWLYTKWVANAAAAKTGMIIKMGATGWEAADVFDPAASQIAGEAYIGFSEAVQTTNTYGWAQIGGPISDAVVGTTTATVGHYIHWANDKLLSLGSAKLSSGGAFGVFTATGTSGTTQDLLLFPKPVNGTT